VLIYLNSATEVTSQAWLFIFSEGPYMPTLFSCRRLITLQRKGATISRAIATVSCFKDFTLWPTFFSDTEQRTLLTTALWKLDQAESREMRKRRKAYKPPKPPPTNPRLQDIFLPDSYYDFEQVSFAMPSIYSQTQLFSKYRGTMME
jgi:hypothetical protein